MLRHVTSQHSRHLESGMTPVPGSAAILSALSRDLLQPQPNATWQPPRSSVGSMRPSPATAATAGTRAWFSHAAPGHRACARAGGRRRQARKVPRRRSGGSLRLRAFLRCSTAFYLRVGPASRLGHCACAGPWVQYRFWPAGGTAEPPYTAHMRSTPRSAPGGSSGARPSRGLGLRVPVTHKKLPNTQSCVCRLPRGHLFSPFQALCCLI